MTRRECILALARYGAVTISAEISAKRQIRIMLEARHDASGEHIWANGSSYNAALKALYAEFKLSPHYTSVKEQLHGLCRLD